jgi:hypothetical protein
MDMKTIFLKSQLGFDSISSVPFDFVGLAWPGHPRSTSMQRSHRPDGLRLRPHFATDTGQAARRSRQSVQ